MLKMEFNIKRNTFLEGIQKTLSIVERKTTIPILNNILIRTVDNKIMIIATDREIGLISDYEAEILSEGEITLSARKIFEMIREIQGEIINFQKEENNWINIMCGKVIYKIPGISTDDFPEVLDDEGVEFFKIKGGIIEEMIDKTFFAMSKEEMRSNLNGVFFKTEKVDSRCLTRMVSTDGHKLALVNFDTGEKDFLDISEGIIIPRKGVSEIKKIVEDEKDDIEIGVKKGICIFRKGNMVLKVSLIDSEYPDYKRVVPTDKGISVQLDRDQFLHSLRRMSVMSSEGYSGVKIKIVEDRMILNSTNPDVGEANEEIEILYKGEEFEISYNVNYLIDAIQVINGKEILFEMRTGLRPGIISEVGEDKYICIIMPLKM